VREGIALLTQDPTRADDVDLADLADAAGAPGTAEQSERSSPQ